jgi:transposase
MLAIKERAFAPLPAVTLEELVPAEHFYRHLERTLDLAFVRDLVRGCYAAGGRPSVDPVVFFKLQLIRFFEGVRSERQLMRVVADRLSLRWYLGYDLDEPLPDHSSLTKIRERSGLDLFRRFFDVIVERWRAAGLVWGAELYLDATKVEANAARASLVPRFAVEAHLAQLFAEPAAAATAPTEEDGATGEGRGVVAPMPLPVTAPPAALAALAASNAQRHDWIAAAGRQAPEARARPSVQADDLASATDPDATFLDHPTGGKHRLGYHTHYVVDGGKARVILRALVTPAEVHEPPPALDLIWQACFRWRLRPHQFTGDPAYGTLATIVAREDGGIRAYVPLAAPDAHRPGFNREDFAYDAARDRYVCPQGTILPRRAVAHGRAVVRYQAPAAACNACPCKAQCTASDAGRTVERHFAEASLDRVRAYHETAAYQKAIRKRAVWVEPLFGEAKQWHGLARFRLRGLEKVNVEAQLTASGQHLKRLLSERGWGRRPWPAGGAGIAAPVAAAALAGG